MALRKYTHLSAHVSLRCSSSIHSHQPPATFGFFCLSQGAPTGLGQHPLPVAHGDMFLDSQLFTHLG